jgi:F-type H+-transporting ATPase subunit b
VVFASNFLVPNATFIVELIAFLLVMAVLAKYILPPLNKIVEERQAVIRQTLVDAETAKKRAEEAEAEYKRLIDQARSESRAMVEEANKAGENLRTERREQGEREYEQRLARAVADIDAAARKAAEDLRRDVSGLVITVVERVVGQGFDAEAHRQLIDRTIGEVEAESSTAPEVNA